MEDGGVSLRQLVEEDVPLLARWFFDPDVLQWLQISEDPPHLRTMEAIRERFVIMRDDPFTEVWRIDADGRPIGEIELVGIHEIQRRAEMHLSIGEKDVWGRGHGSRAVRLVLHHAFENLRLRRVFAMADADNARVIRLFERCGFEREGLLREHRLRHGRPVDMVVMGILGAGYAASNSGV
jgi:RimJ/RimL family protein N-acetyltransferase